MIIREIVAADRADWLRMRHALWPGSLSDHDAETRAHFEGRRLAAAVVFVAEADGRLAGFLELDFRKYAPGCASSPVPFIEGWYVDDAFRGRGIGRALVEAAEAHARAAGYTEIASDAEVDNTGSLAAHGALGYEEIERVVCFRRSLSFELQPVLDGPLLHLRPLRAEDYDALYAVAADRLIWEQHPSSDRYREDQFKIFFAEALASGGALVAIDRADGTIVGSSRYYGYDAERSEVEIGWSFLARSHWGGRYNREMKQLMLGHAFRFVARVIFLVGPENHRSQRAVEKIGGVRAGIVHVRGRDSVRFELTRDRFESEIRQPGRRVAE